MISAFGTPPCYFTDAMKASLITYYLRCWLDGAVSCCGPSRGVVQSQHLDDRALNMDF
ncbi:uncharacterized protein BDW47DRAFT_104700 [Aspergillus candidus]|uniref:Uncharacterized protein n=1 Tax=Aspergillus candidus TaxID=41067 RepID=A0A2I2FDI4_ASPCN|nr:hypothetical protein BDW47DRAFT_104700 [Aspergillus candidus]PLB38695.1 hypothetical protein BDW47DRAFT_104700 [Aspergillus candidus]